MRARRPHFEPVLGKPIEGGPHKEEYCGIVRPNIGGTNLPMIEVLICENRVKALFDTGCSRTLVKSRFGNEIKGKCNLRAVDGNEVSCIGLSPINVSVLGRNLSTDAIVVESLLDGVEAVIGMDLIGQLGPITVNGSTIALMKEDIAAAGRNMSEWHIEDKDFNADFDGKNWTVGWKFKNTERPVLNGTVACYQKGLEGKKKEEFDKEVGRWIEEGILVPWKETVTKGVIPLMAVEQPTKNKVRPVLDFRELNEHVECHTGDDVTDICSEKLREWRKLDESAELVDLKNAYLQIRVTEDLWRYQLVNYNGKTYCLTRLGFGLCSAPRIMSKILKEVLGTSREIKEATSSYIDDIIVDTEATQTEKVINHLRDYGLETKPAEKLDEAAVLGLKVRMSDQGVLKFGRANVIPEIGNKITRRELFSICGKLVGHYPVASWLRIACSYIKRQAEGSRWEDDVGPLTTQYVQEVVSRVRLEDPVQGVWKVPKTDEGRVWCDASSIGMGVVVEIGGSIVEDAAWLRKKTDYNHINVAELEAALKGVNLAVKWGLRKIELVTDSATVSGWINLTLSEERRIKTKGAAEIIVKRRLFVLKNLINELGLVITVKCVASQVNKSDVLTRVKKQWIENERSGHEENECCAVQIELQEGHDAHHMGVERTLFLARKVDPTVTKDAVKKIVRECEQCQSINPAPVVHEKGSLHVKENWKRLAIDVTHYKNLPYLTMVDCGPGRFAIWRALRYETANCIVQQLEEVFYERGPVDEILMDNATAFRSEEMRRFLDRWKTKPYYRATYRPSGNGIVERHHRTIKSSSEKGSMNPIEAVFWYNMSAREGQNENTVPQRAVYKYDWRHPCVQMKEEDEKQLSKINIGDEVWVKPPNARCTTKWNKGRVTKVCSANNIEVNDMPRHVLDIRPIRTRDEVLEDEETNEDDEEKDDEIPGAEVETERRQSSRVKREVDRYSDVARRASSRSRQVPDRYGTMA